MLQMLGRFYAYAGAARRIPVIPGMHLILSSVEWQEPHYDLSLVPTAVCRICRRLQQRYVSRRHSPS